MQYPNIFKICQDLPAYFMRVILTRKSSKLADMKTNKLVSSNVT